MFMVACANEQMCTGEAGNAMLSEDSQMWMFSGSWLLMCLWLLIPLGRKVVASAVFLGDGIYFLFSSQKSQESLCSGVGWSLVVWLGKSQIKMCCSYVCECASQLIPLRLKRTLASNERQQKFISWSNLHSVNMNKVLEEEEEQDEGWKLSICIVFSVPSLQTQTLHFFFHESSYCSLSADALFSFNTLLL